ncbi:hypothetical protein D9758_009445 [Tetrapyrgos nigripes]|uniref:laccase n=1 Tax=Tetrapyrgos nigripes TaxID=182062 RepID=A0A8H5D3K6_9AGAR|nr:hypothetical protein D9758_009445 [Tetrapyrgos nigripes]
MYSGVDLVIVNAEVSPDGFTRSAVLAGGVFPGPVITGNKDKRLRPFNRQFDAQDNFRLTQSCDGLRGPFIIYDPDDPYKDLYDVDDDLPAPSAGLMPLFNSTLINGLGRYQGGSASPLAVVKVEYGKSDDLLLNLDIRELQIIEADGEYTEPLLVDSIQIYAGIRAKPNKGNTGFSNGINSAILRYTGAPIEESAVSVNTTSLRPLKETDLHPLYNPQAPGQPTIDGVDVDLTLVLGFKPTTHEYTVNGEIWEPPSLPILLQILNGNTPPDDVLPSVYKLPANKNIQATIVVEAAHGAPHPMHLHNHRFSVIRGANSSEFNYANPVRRDTVSTGFAGDSVTIRWRTDSSGPWLADARVWIMQSYRQTRGYSNIDWRCKMNRGMSVVFVEDIEGIPEKNPVPDEWKNLCPAYDRLTDEEIGGQPTSMSSPASSSVLLSAATIPTSFTTGLDGDLPLGNTLGMDSHIHARAASSNFRRHRQRRLKTHGVEADSPSSLF